MTKNEIQTKIKELKTLMSEHQKEFSVLEKELYQAISAYQKALEEEKLKEIRSALA